MIEDNTVFYDESTPLTYEEFMAMMEKIKPSTAEGLLLWTTPKNYEEVKKFIEYIEGVECEK